MTEPRSRVEHLARALNTLAKLLFVAFLIAGAAGVMWVDNEFTGNPPLWRYVLAVADGSGFLVAAVIAQVGSALVESLGRVRTSILDALVQEDEAGTIGLEVDPREEQFLQN